MLFVKLFTDVNGGNKIPHPHPGLSSAVDIYNTQWPDSTAASPAESICGRHLIDCQAKKLQHSHPTVSPTAKDQTPFKANAGCQIQSWMRWSV